MVWDTIPETHFVAAFLSKHKVARVWVQFGSDEFLLTPNLNWPSLLPVLWPWTGANSSAMDRVYTVLIRFEPGLTHFSAKLVNIFIYWIYAIFAIDFCFCTSAIESSIHRFFSAARFASICAWRRLRSFLYLPLTVWMAPKFSGSSHA